MSQRKGKKVCASRAKNENKNSLTLQALEEKKRRKQDRTLKRRAGNGSTELWQRKT